MASGKERRRIHRCLTVPYTPVYNTHLFVPELSIKNCPWVSFQWDLIPENQYKNWYASGVECVLYTSKYGVQIHALRIRLWATEPSNMLNKS